MTDQSITEMFAPTGDQKETLERTAAQLAEFIAIEDEAVTALKKEHTERKENLDATKTQLAELLASAGVDSLKLESGLAPKVMKSVKYYKQAGVPDEDLFAFLERNNLGDIIKPQVHFQTLQSTMKEYVAQGGVVNETVFNVTDVLTVRMNGKAKFLAARNAANGEAESSAA